MHPDYGEIALRSVIASREEPIRPCTSIRASTLCRLLNAQGALACQRRAVYEIALPMLREPFSDELLAVFEKGREEEETVKVRLRRLGFEVNTAQRRYDTGEQILPVTGTSDFELSGDIVECKSVSGMAWPNLLATLAQDGGLREDTGYLGSYWRQLQLYMHLGGYERGLLLFSNRDRLAMAQEECMPCKEWFANAMTSAEEIRRLALPVIERVQAGTPPDDLDIQQMLPPYPDEVCGEACSYRKACKPGRAYVRDLDVLYDDIVQDVLLYTREREATKAVAARWDEVKDRLRERLEALPEDVDEYTFLVEDFEIRARRVRPRGKAAYWQIQEPKEAQSD